MQRILVLVFILFTSACATYQGKVGQARSALAAGNYDSANATLEPLTKIKDKDQLVYVLDHATSLQVQGRFQESSRYFILADQIADYQNYTSLAREAGSLLFAEEMVQYKGEDFEVLLINTMNAINFALMGDLSSARVETRRVTDKINFFKNEKKLTYAENPFLYWLNAQIWEANRDWDSAYIDINKAYGLGMSNKYIHEDLVRMADRSGRPGDRNRYQSEFNITEKPWKNRLNGEVILIYQQGWGPRKRPNPNARRFPMLYPLPSSTTRAQIVWEGDVLAKTEVAYDLESAAIADLNNQYAGLVAKRMAGIVAKEVVSHQVRKENPAAGALLNIAMHLSDRADLRQWSTLPKTIQVARIYLPEGTHQIKLQGLSGSSVREETEAFEVKVRSGRKHFIGWRTF